MLLVVSLIFIKGWIFTTAIAKSLFWSCHCLQAQAVQHQVVLGEAGNYLLLVFIALKMGRNMSMSIKHKYVWKIPCREPLNAFIIHCWYWNHKWCYFFFCALEWYHNQMKCCIIAQIISIIRNPERAIKKCWNMAECACAGEDKAASCTVGALSHCRGRRKSRHKSGWPGKHLTHIRVIGGEIDEKSHQ